MVDVVSSQRRSQMMSGIRSKNTRPELFLRSGLHRRGLRFRLHNRSLPGAPDMVFPKRDAVLFAHGCFWHGHDCHLFKWPSTRPDFWKAKIESNRLRDEAALNALLEAGWRVGVVWECALKGKYRRQSEDVLQKCEDWLRSRGITMEIDSIEARPPL
jgi:DNA mismatch endonuclease, patch repair protein